MQTKITIDHVSVDALKSSELWAQIMALLLVDGAVSVTEIEAVENDASDDKR